MSEMISLRTFQLATTLGYTIQFEANIPVSVPSAAVPAAMAAGCVPTDVTDAPFHDDLGRSRVEFQGDVRRSMLYMAVRSTAEKNDAKEFDGAGTPKADVVSAKLGFDVGRKELVDIYQQYLQAKAENREFALHPASASILRVIDAESKAELLELADEFGVAAAKAKGLSARELRKLLLVKFDGVAG